MHMKPGNLGTGNLGTNGMFSAILPENAPGDADPQVLAVALCDAKALGPV